MLLFVLDDLDEAPQLGPSRGLFLFEPSDGIALQLLARLTFMTTDAGRAQVRAAFGQAS